MHCCRMTRRCARGVSQQTKRCFSRVYAMLCRLSYVLGLLPCGVVLRVMLRLIVCFVAVGVFFTNFYKVHNFFHGMAV